MAGGKATASASGSTKEKTRKHREDGEAISDTADEGHAAKKKKVNSAQPWLADERADDLRLAEKALFTRAVFLTQRLASCLHASAKIIKGPRALSQVEAIQEAWATVQSYVSKTTSTLWRAQSRIWRLRFPLVTSLWVTLRSLMMEKPRSPKRSRRACRSRRTSRSQGRKKNLMTRTSRNRKKRLVSSLSEQLLLVIPSPSFLSSGLCNLPRLHVMPE